MNLNKNKYYLLNYPWKCKSFLITKKSVIDYKLYKLNNILDYNLKKMNINKKNNLTIKNHLL